MEGQGLYLQTKPARLFMKAAIQGLFMALEHPLPAAAISVCAASVFPLALLLALMPLKLTGLWWNYTASSFFTALLALILCRKYNAQEKCPPSLWAVG